MKRICVFCGSSVGERTAYVDAARLLAAELVQRQLGLVYGGGGVGLMGALADAMLAAGGEVIGVIPGPLASRELAHAGVTEMLVVDSMHERKATMASLADGFIALPGGLGTLEETVEQLTWAQLGQHKKPILLVNVRGFWDPLIRLIDHMRAEAFIRPGLETRALVVDTVDAALPAIVEALEPYDEVAAEARVQTKF